MKAILYYVLGSLLLCGAATSCKQADATPQAEFFVQATKNYAPWTSVGTGTYSKTRRQFYVFGQTGNAAQADAFSLGFALPAAPQLTPVQALPAYWRVLIGYDGIVDSYETADAASLPQVEITRLDTVTKVVEGRFQALLLRQKQYTSKTEVLSFNNGSFRVRYTEVP